MVLMVVAPGPSSERLMEASAVGRGEAGWGSIGGGVAVGLLRRGAGVWLWLRGCFLVVPFGVEHGCWLGGFILGWLGGFGSLNNSQGRAMLSPSLLRAKYAGSLRVFWILWAEAIA